jgi:hypothetical protein
VCGELVLRRALLAAGRASFAIATGGRAVLVARYTPRTSDHVAVTSQEGLRRGRRVDGMKKEIIPGSVGGWEGLAVGTRQVEILSLTRKGLCVAKSGPW